MHIFIHNTHTQMYIYILSSYFQHIHDNVASKLGPFRACIILSIAEELKQLPFLVGVLDLFTSFLVSIVNFYSVRESHRGPWDAFFAQGC